MHSQNAAKNNAFEERITSQNHAPNLQNVAIAIYYPKGDAEFMRLLTGSFPHIMETPQTQQALGDPEKDHRGILAEISERRNAIENSLRSFLAEGLKFAKGAGAAKAALGALTEKRRVLLLEYSYHEMWEQMYFNELRLILKKNWDAFQRRIRLELGCIEQMMEHINNCRADAHAKTINEDNFAYLRVCFRKFEDLLGLGRAPYLAQA